MSDTTILKKLLEAENSSRALLREAEEAVIARVHEARAALQEGFRGLRGEKLGEIAAEEEVFLRELEEERESRMAAFEERLRAVEPSFAAAERELKAILGLP